MVTVCSSSRQAKDQISFWWKCHLESGDSLLKKGCIVMAGLGQQRLAELVSNLSLFSEPKSISIRVGESDFSYQSSVCSTLLYFSQKIVEMSANGNTKEQSILQRCSLCVRLEWVRIINTQLCIMCCFRRKFLFPIPMMEFRLFLLIWFLTFRGEMESEQNSRILTVQNSCLLLKVEHKDANLIHPEKYTKEREGLKEGTED